MLWIKAVHIISIITWFAGIFYLPRLFVYHAQARDKISITRFKIMEKRLYYTIMMPSFIISTFFGLWLLYDYAYHAFYQEYWLWLKLFLVLMLIIYHFYCGHLMSVFKQNANKHSDKFYRILNELPVFILLSVVFLVVVKPF